MLSAGILYSVSVVISFLPQVVVVGTIWSHLCFRRILLWTVGMVDFESTNTFQRSVTTAVVQARTVRASINAAVMGGAKESAFEKYLGG